LTEAVIVASARTLVGRARRGTLVNLDAFRLAEIAIGATGVVSMCAGAGMGSAMVLEIV
jgi:acetyl-CoA acetyltransferase